jgi:outer membrane protein
MLSTLMLSLFGAQAQASNFMVRMRALSVTPDVSGSPSAINGAVDITNTSVPEIDFTYFVNDSFAFELILATTTHKVSVHNSALNNVDLGDVSLLPPTLLAQYHHTFGDFKPYVGAGINYTIFYGANPGFAKKVDYSNEFGYALQLGTDYKIAENTYINLDIKKIFLSTDVKVDTYAHGSVTADVDVDPLIVV